MLNSIQVQTLDADLSFPENPLSIEVEFKAKPSRPLAPSPSPEGTVGAQIVAPVYSDEQHNTWTILQARQKAMLEGRLCDAYILGRTRLELPETKVPHLADLSQRLQRHSGWQVVRADGFVDIKKFFRLLANRCFPCTDFIRHQDELEYTPAPDMFHDIVGHLPMITDPYFSAFFHAYGIAGARAATQEVLDALSRIYWFTAEFGLINPTAHKGALRDPSLTQIYGAGIASSVGEIAFSLSDKVEKIPFDIERVANTAYDIHHMQDKLFELESFEELEKSFLDWALHKGLLTRQ